MKDDTTLSEAVYAASLEAEPVPVEEEPAMIVESEPDALHKTTGIPTGTLDESEAQVLEETFSPVKADTGVADADILPEAQSSIAIDDLNSTVESVAILSHKPAVEENDIPESIAVQGVLTDIDPVAVISSTQDKSGAEVEVDSIEEINTEVRHSLYLVINDSPPHVCLSGFQRRSGQCFINANGGFIRSGGQGN